MQTFCYPVMGEYIEEIVNTLKSHPEWYGEVTIDSMAHAQMYMLVDSEGNLVAFFGIAAWVDEDVLCYVYVKEEHRQKGIFNKIVKYVKNHCTRCSITIGAAAENKLANEIYSKKFKLLGIGNDQGWHYLIVDRREKK